MFFRPSPNLFETKLKMSLLWSFFFEGLWTYLGNFFMPIKKPIIVGFLI